MAKKYTQQQKIELGHKVGSYFDEHELRVLAFDLDVDFDNLPGEVKITKAIELVKYLDRRGQLDQLVVTIQV